MAKPDIKVKNEFEAIEVGGLGKLKHKNGFWLAIWILVAIGVLQLASIIVTCCMLPPLPEKTEGLIEAREKTLVWGKDVMSVVTSSLAPILAAIAGYLFGRDSAEKTASSSEEE